MKVEATISGNQFASAVDRTRSLQQVSQSSAKTSKRLVDTFTLSGDSASIDNNPYSAAINRTRQIQQASKNLACTGERITQTFTPNYRDIGAKLSETAAEDRQAGENMVRNTNATRLWTIEDQKAAIVDLARRKGRG